VPRQPVSADLFASATLRHVEGMSRRSRSQSEVQISDDEDTPADAKLAKLPGPEERRFGRHVRSLRRARGATQEVLAARSGVSADTIRRLEHGSFSPSLDTLIKLCKGLSLSLSTFFESFELGGDGDLSRELSDLLATRTADEIKLAIRVVQVLLDEPTTDEHDASTSNMPATILELDASTSNMPATVPEHDASTSNMLGTTPEHDAATSNMLGTVPEHDAPTSNMHATTPDRD
jgi:transcriptional regulator with XRE-family HTH domain